MSSFVITPINIDYIESIFRDPVTGKWVIPVLKYNTNIGPYYGEIDPLNEDPRYHEKVIDHFYIRLTEKWLHKQSVFRKLLEYFTVEKKGDSGTVTLNMNADKTTDISKFDEMDIKYIFKFIEKHFIKEKFIKKILKEFVARTHIKWYDLFNNSDTIKELFAHKLKKLIVNTIYELQTKK